MRGRGAALPQVYALGAQELGGGRSFLFLFRVDFFKISPGALEFRSTPPSTNTILLLSGGVGGLLVFPPPFCSFPALPAVSGARGGGGFISPLLVWRERALHTKSPPPLLYSFIYLFFYASSSLCVCVLISLLELNLHHGDIFLERERERENAVSIEKGGERFQ